ncbi:MAG: hypothetical protein PVH74_12315 [Desulfobacterales bacterium]|jgi:hypothetical protein|nr:hypothetical protein [Deltaproteobacteria bacterium]
MKLFLLILGIVVIALNVFLWYAKKQRKAASIAKTTDRLEKSVDLETNSTDFLDSPAADELKQAAAAELGIPVEELNRMSAEEIVHLATQKGLIKG